ncbi:MAG: lipid A biosynthesis acyltransferase [Gammaproteobacteria bacterium]|nr:lipid A biosynthesis acyltransferase [Gammaproteobacteria bacterium]
MAQHYFLPRGLIGSKPALHRLGWRIEAWILRFFFLLMRMLGPERSIAVAHWAFARIGPRTGKRKRVYRNLKVALPNASADEIERYLVDIFGNVGVAVAELVHLPRLWAEREQRFEFVADPAITFIGTGRPAVLVTAHVGGWSLANFIAARYDFPLTVVYAPESNPYIHDMFFELRSALPVKLMRRDNAMRGLMKELAAGHTVGLASDVRLDAGEPVAMFGHDMLTNTVPARLALRYDCELIPVHVERLPGARYRIHLFAPIKPTDASAPAAAAARDMATSLNRAFEAWIRATPGEWMCLARRWPKEVERAAAGVVKRRP